MDLWSPPHDAPHLLEWWRPLMLVSRRARLDRFPWPVHLDEFRLAGRVNRQGRPDIWIYEHHANGGSVCADARGETYKFTATPRARSVGRFIPCPVRTALWRARLPDVVEPIVSRDETPKAGWEENWDSDSTAASDADAAHGGALREEAEGDDSVEQPGATEAGDGVRSLRRRHLTLIAG